jgi:hypothetical protein
MIFERRAGEACMSGRGVLLILCILGAVVGCEPGDPKPGRGAASKGEVSLRDLRMMSSAGLADAGLTPDTLESIAALHRLKDLERCVVKFKHWVSLDRPALVGDKILEREGYMILLGTRNNRVVGLTTRCSIDFRWGLKHDDVAQIDDDKPPLMAGIIALEVPGEKSRDFYLVDHESNLGAYKHASDFNGEFFVRMGMSPAFWPQLLESGDRVRISALGNNDLAFVTFEKERILGVPCRETPSGLRVDEVLDDSVAFRAGVKEGDVIVALNDRPIRTLADLDSAKATCAFNKEAVIRIRREGATLDRYAVFHHPGNFMIDGKVSNLGLEEPEEIISCLMTEMQKLGGLLRRDLLLRCHWCHEREARTPVVKSRSWLEFAVDVAPLVVGLIVAGPAGAVAADRIARAGKAFLEGYNTVSALASEVTGLAEFFKVKCSVGRPLIFDPSAVSAKTGDTLEGVDLLGESHRIQLAYIKHRNDDSKAYLAAVLKAAKEGDGRILALPDGRDHLGKLHCHVFLVKAGQRIELNRILDGWLNLIMVASGSATAYDAGVGDGHSTRILLKALRLVEERLR